MWIPAGVHKNVHLPFPVSSGMAHVAVVQAVAHRSSRATPFNSQRCEAQPATAHWPSQQLLTTSPWQTPTLTEDCPWHSIWVALGPGESRRFAIHRCLEAESEKTSEGLIFRMPTLKKGETQGDSQETYQHQEQTNHGRQHGTHTDTHPDFCGRFSIYLIPKRRSFSTLVKGPEQHKMILQCFSLVLLMAIVCLHLLLTWPNLIFPPFPPELQTKDPSAGCCRRDEWKPECGVLSL